MSESTDKENESSDDAHALTAIPHGRGSTGSGNDQHTLSDKQPLQKRILRKVWLLLKATNIQTCHIFDILMYKQINIEIEFNLKDYRLYRFLLHV